MADTPTPPCPGQRRDAIDNRRRILAAAAATFATEGLSASVAEVARRAGVGNATVYRHFAGKEQLVEAVFEQWTAARRASAARAAGDPDPWRALITFVEDSLESGTTSRAVTGLLTRLPTNPLHPLLTAAVDRCRGAGLLREGLTVEDVVLALIGVGRTIDVAFEVAPEQWRRHLAVVLDGLRAPGSGPLPGTSITEADLSAALAAELRD